MKSIKETLRGNLLIFTFGDAIRQLSVFITFPYFSLYIQALGGSIVDIGLVNSLRPLAAFFMYPIAGYIADKYSRVKIITLTGYVSAGLFTILMLAPDWKILAFGNFVFGLMVFHFPAMSALMADSLSPRHRGMGYSLWRVFPSALGIIAPYIGGYLITILGVEQAMRVLYGFSIVTAVVIATINFKFLQETKTRKPSDPSGGRILGILSDSYRNMVNVLRWLPKNLKAFTIVLILSFFINNLTAPYWVVHGIEKVGLSELQWGIVLLVAALINVALLVPAGMLVDRFNVKKVITLALVSSTIPAFLFPFSRSFTDTVLLFFVLAIGNSFLTSSAPAYMAASVPSDKRGRVMAVLGQGMLFINTRGGPGGPGMGAVLTLPSVLGSVLGGLVYSYNPTLPWILLSLTIIINVLIILFFISSNERNVIKETIE